MLSITVFERVIERCNDVRSSDLNRIIKMTRRTIGSYSSNLIPRVGDTISLDTAYTVLAVIYAVQTPAIAIEVTPYVPIHTHDIGGYSFKESWPLITSLEEENMD